MRCSCLVPLSRLSSRPPYFTDVFPPEEFATRRARVMAEIGDATAVIPGGPEMSAEGAFRQSKQFFYLTGVGVPGAIPLIDGKSKRSTLSLGPGLVPFEKSMRS